MSDQVAYFPGWKKKSIQEVLSRESSGAATPPHLRCSTPEPDTPDARHSAFFLERHKNDVEAYKMRLEGFRTSTLEGLLQGNTFPESVLGKGDSTSGASQDGA